MFLQKPMLGTQLDWSNPLNDDVVLDLLMNEGHGDRVNDLSGWGNHGTLHGFDFPPTRASGWNPGMDGIALAFDGLDDYIKVPDSGSLHITKAITVDVLMYVSVAQTGKAIIQKGALGTYDWMLYLSGGTTPNIDFYVQDDSYGTAISGWVNISFNSLTRATGVFDNGKLYLYVNGILMSHTDTSLTNVRVTSNDINIGRWKTDGFVNALIARARILPRAMSPFEVMQTQINPYGVYLR